MKASARLILPAFLVGLLALSGCDNTTPAAGSGDQAAANVLAVPTSQDDGEWRQYVGRMIGKNIKRRSMPPFAFYLPPDDEEEVEKQIAHMRTTVLRPIARDTTLGFGSRDSGLLASRMNEVFEPVPDNALHGVRVVFVGHEADRETVEAAVRDTGAEFVFAQIGS